MFDGYLVQAFQALALRDAVADEDGVEIFKVGEADKLVDGGIVAHVAFLVGVGIAPFLGGNAEHFCSPLRYRKSTGLSSH